MQSNISITEVLEFSESVAKSIRYLVQLLDSHYQELSDDDVRHIISSPSTRLLVATKDEKIIGMITLVIYRIPYKKKGWLEDLVVDPEERGQGIGKRLIEAAITLAKKESIKALDLTSQPIREDANKMYVAMGFEKRTTNVYRLNIA